MAISNDPAEMHPRTGRLLKEDGTTINEADLIGGNGLPIEFGVAADRDGFGRLRISQPFGIFDQKFITGRHSPLWEERLTGTIIEHGTVTAGPFQVGDVITGGTSGKTGTITAVGSGNVTYTTSNNDFTDGETITGSISGASAAVTTHNTGADIVFNYDKSTVSLSLGTVSGQKVIRQTIRYFPYVPGFAHHVIMTATPAAIKTNLKQTIMYGDALNGFGYKITDSVVSVFLRSSTSGSPVDTEYNQVDWNVDALDGNGPSGVTLDISKAEILDVDFQWLGVGTGRFFLNIGGASIHIHDIDHANIQTSTYMKTPTLPIRYEIENTGATASASTLEQICCSVTSDGGYLLPGIEFAAGTGFENEVTVTGLNFVPVFAMRLKNEYPTGEPNRRQVRYISSDYGTRSNDCDFRLLHLHNPTFVGASWTDINAEGSAVEYTRVLTSYTAEHIHVIDFKPVFSGQAQNGNIVQSTAEYINQHSFLSQNFESSNSQAFLIEARARTGTAQCVGGIREIEAE